MVNFRICLPQRRTGLGIEIENQTKSFARRRKHFKQSLGVPELNNFLNARVYISATRVVAV